MVRAAAPYILAALGLAVLMIVHEGGHYLAARKFGMRVIRFSIGFGPRLYQHRPVGSPTVYQVCIIPFLAYVQIAGMNPYEEIDPNDPGSYANASLLGRIVTIGAGPLANYFFASVLMFFAFVLGGHTIVDEASMRVSVASEGAAHAADIRDGDKMLAVNEEPIHDWDALKKAIGAHPGERIIVTIERNHAILQVPVTPAPKGDKYEGKILVGPEFRTEPVTLGRALVLSLSEPPKVVIGLVRGLGRMIMLKEKPELSGPVGIVRETAGAVRTGAGPTLHFLGALSAYLGGFNLLPFPALDGGRLIFLAFEAASRRRPDAKIEARVHAIGLLMMLTLIAFVTYTEIIPK
jgi:regulator of sigma E protease